MSLTASEKDTVQSVIAVFETGHGGGGDPAAVAVLNDHAGISFGVGQATDAGGGLDAIVLEYIDRGGRFTADLRPYIPRLAANESASNPTAPWVQTLAALLRRAGREDPIMLAAEQAVFDRMYWAPCASQCEVMGLRLPLSWAVVYDTCIQSRPGAVASMRGRFSEVPPARGGDERAWAVAYMAAREAWLSAFVGRDDGHTAAVRRTTYRVKALRALAAADKWTLAAPLAVPMGRGVVVVS